MTHSDCPSNQPAAEFGNPLGPGPSSTSQLVNKLSRGSHSLPAARHHSSSRSHYLDEPSRECRLGAASNKQLHGARADRWRWCSRVHRRRHIAPLAQSPLSGRALVGSAREAAATRGASSHSLSSAQRESDHRKTPKQEANVAQPSDAIDQTANRQAAKPRCVAPKGGDRNRETPAEQ
jgi:hypothetical protein